jgi:formylglycine-generating enzyme required for sulfatase activity
MVSVMQFRLSVYVAAVFLTTLAGSTDAAESPKPDSFTIRADWFDSGNIKCGKQFADKYPCIIHGGIKPDEANYRIDFPVTADYQVEALYAALGSRPVDLLLDGEKKFQKFAQVTGSWKTSSAKWETVGSIKIVKGQHTISLICPGSCIPHICALRFTPSATLPKGWQLRRKAAVKGAKVLPKDVKSPMSGWFNDVSADRAKKGESGSTFTGHMADETRMVALLKNRLTKVELVDSRQLKLDEIDLNDELSYFGGMFDELNEAKPDWKIRVSSPEDQFNFPLSIGRYTMMLNRTIGLVDRFRQVDDVADDYLEKQRQAAQTELNNKPKEELLNTKAGRQEFLKKYCRAAKLYSEVARANPFLDFEQLLFVQRGKGGLGLPYNWQSNCSFPRNAFDDQLVSLLINDPDGKTETVVHPERLSFIGDIDLHFDGGKLLYSAIGIDNRWNIFEINLGDKSVRQVTPTMPEADSYDACYLPDGAIIFSSTACYSAVPCVNGGTRVANLYRIEPDGKTIRRLCFDQEHNWCPTVLPNGRVLYQRWEYTDTPHSHARLLFHMNPDGTGQMEYYGSNSYWPNSMFYARPLPGSSNKFVTIVSGHHGVTRMGELVKFDLAKGRRESDGAVQRICSNQKEIASKKNPRLESTLIVDNLVDLSWPKFLHPYPLSEDDFLVTCQPKEGDNWGIYLVDTDNNLTLIKEQPEVALMEPTPVRKTVKPPIVPNRVKPGEKEATVYLADIYKGEGLKGIPRGTVKKLRIVSYHYLYPNMGGPQGVIGMEGPWDIKRIIGTVPVRPDGSASFRVPANTPIALQPLDAEGKSLQQMRSWFTAMPGEVISCVGCHESQNQTPPKEYASALSAPIDEITPWHGPARGFNFAREVQPVLDRYCIGCHDGTKKVDGQVAIDLRGLENIKDYRSAFHYGGKDAGHFSTSYAALHRFVRRGGLESDYHLLMPMEYHADSTQLVQMLRKGHYGVKMDNQAWDRLLTWIDLNAPYHGTLHEIAGKDRVQKWEKLRRDNMVKYANIDPDFEAIFPSTYKPGKPIVPTITKQETAEVVCENWPLSIEEAKKVQAAECRSTTEAIDLGNGTTLKLVRIPAGQFVMGDDDGQFTDDGPQHAVTIDRPFWIGQFEVTNGQFAAFNPNHDSRVESRDGMQFGVRGFYVNRPEQPVVRISWQEAVAFCDWLSEKTDRQFSLPTEAQWEYACRAGTDGPFYFGDKSADFSAYANLADKTLNEFTCHPYFKERRPLTNASKYDRWIPKVESVDDKGFLSEATGRYKPNAWELFDMHGNVSEWTASAYRPYPYDADDGRNDLSADLPRVVRGGSWRDRPHRATSSFRLPYRAYQGVYNVGFRVVAEEK